MIPDFSFPHLKFPASTASRHGGWKGETSDDDGIERHYRGKISKQSSTNKITVFFV